MNSARLSSVCVISGDGDSASSASSSESDVLGRRSFGRAPGAEGEGAGGGGGGSPGRGEAADELVEQDAEAGAGAPLRLGWRAVGGITSGASDKASKGSVKGGYKVYH